MITTELRAGLSERFLSARRLAEPLADFPGDLPTDLDAAYAVQDRSIVGWPDDVAGWKVGGIPHSFQERFGETRLAGPIFRRSIKVSNGNETPMPAFQGGFAAVEGEIVLKTGESVPPGAVDPDSPAVRDLVSKAFIGVELASSPLAIINELGPLSIISDFGNNGGLLLGDEIADWHSTDISGRSMRTLIDGEEIGSAKLAPLEDGALGALRFLISNCAKRQITLPAGTYISTGAVTGVHSAKVGSSATVAFEGCTPLHLKLVPRAPMA